MYVRTTHVPYMGISRDFLNVANSTAIGQYSALRGLSLEESFIWDITVVIVGVGFLSQATIAAVNDNRLPLPLLLVCTY